MGWTLTGTQSLSLFDARSMFINSHFITELKIYHLCSFIIAFFSQVANSIFQKLFYNLMETQSQKNVFFFLKKTLEVKIKKTHLFRL